jgi:phage shock protein A
MDIDERDEIIAKARDDLRRMDGAVRALEEQVAALEEQVAALKQEKQDLIDRFDLGDLMGCQDD